jgi:ubiquinone/menaquinone biosynthesis C-methylase UbiE
VSINVLQHVADFDVALGEFARVLATGGVLRVIDGSW